VTLRLILFLFFFQYIGALDEMVTRLKELPQ